MKVVKVPIKESSCIEYARYCKAAKKLLVKYKEYDARYIYSDVELELVKQWVKYGNEGGSIGSFFVTQIKSCHSFTKLSPKSTTSVPSSTSKAV